MRPRTRYTLLVVFAVLCALAAAIYLRQKAPPEVARLLPESDAIVYFNLKPLRNATHFDRNPPAPSGSLRQFIDGTGIVPERDINQAAVALHRMDNPYGPNGPVAFSEVVSGKFDTQRLSRYLASLAASQEIYANRTIYAIPSEGRTLRVVLLDYDTVAASNAPTSEQIHSIVDRSRSAASPFAGCSLLSARYADVPPFSQAWAIGHIGLPFGPSGSQPGRIKVAGLELPLPADTTFVASLRYTTGLKLRIDELTADEPAAQRSAQSLNQLLTLLRTLQQGQLSNPAFTELLNSIAIEPRKDRTTLTATVPPEALKQLTHP
jgi:hypothetical protein